LQKISSIKEKIMENIIRQHYLNKVERYFGKNTIIVLTGQRRVGKSYLLKQLRDQKRNEADSNVIYIDKEKREFDSIQTYRELNDHIEHHYQKGKKNYIFIDEIQDIEEFERSVRSFHTEHDAEIVITGSNAKMLSNELSTLIGGRYKEIYIQSLSYQEFLTFHNLSDSDDALSQYIQFGGLPGLVKIGLDEDDAREYQMDIYHTVLLKDVVMRNQIRQRNLLGKLSAFSCRQCWQTHFSQQHCKVHEVTRRERDLDRCLQLHQVPDRGIHDSSSEPIRYPRQTAVRE